MNQVASTQAVRPVLRGALHGGALAVAVVVGTIFVIAAPEGRSTAAAAVFAGAVVTMLLASTLYHRITWSAAVRPWMRRIDHAGIYVLIAGTYTAVGLVSLHGLLQRLTLLVVWAGALAATVLKFCWVSAPKWVSAAVGIALGWVGIVAMPQIAQAAGVTCVALLAAGGLAYTAGAIVYARRRPDPVPAVFGYHELFHALTIVALACQYVAIAFFVVKVG